MFHWDYIYFNNSADAVFILTSYLFIQNRNIHFQLLVLEKISGDHKNMHGGCLLCPLLPSLTHPVSNRLSLSLTSSPNLSIFPLSISPSFLNFHCSFFPFICQPLSFAPSPSLTLYPLSLSTYPLSISPPLLLWQSPLLTIPNQP